MSLRKYRQKRNFKLTTEPYGQAKPSKKKRYSIQKHAARHLHYDLRLELNGTLKSWAVPKGPSLDPSIKRLAVHVEDHPIEYGSFEGTIPSGQYGAGTVLLWDSGTWICDDPDPNKAYKKGHLSFTLQGEKLKGSWHLVQIKEDPKNWLLIKVNDKFARSGTRYDILDKKPNSVINRRNSNKKTKMPSLIHPELASLVDTPPKGEEWLYEVKYDGYRIICFINDKKIKLMTRNQKDWTKKFPSLVKALQRLNLKNAILDGELVALNTEGRSEFELLQNALQTEKVTAELVYYVFDLLYYNHTDLTSSTLIKRKQQLQKLIPTSDSLILYSEHIIGNGERLYKKACKLHLEGIIAKNKNSLYLQKQTHEWLKIKCNHRQEFIVVGFTPAKGNRAYFGSLLLAVYENKKHLRYCGRVGTGFTEEALKQLYQLLKKYKTKPIKITNFSERLSVTWVEPRILAEVEFIEWTKKGLLRHPSYKGLRDDKKALQIIREQPMSLSHPEKSLYAKAKVTKLELADYYQQVQRWILPYLSKRFLTILRCPEGQGKKCFYQRHLNKSEIKHLYSHLTAKTKKAEAYFYLKNQAGLTALVQLDVLEIHPWGCRIDNLEKPDLVIFDLDPGTGLEWKKMIEGAFFIKDQLDKLKLTSFVKTSGSKGLHIVIPIQRHYNWDKVKIFSKTFVAYMVTLKPNLFVAKMNKAQRKGKIFIDYLRNQKGATTVAPYSTRANATAAVSTPLSWDELSVKIKADTFTLQNLPKRLTQLKQDPWRDFFKLKQKLPIPQT